jgi:hypothetical protein
MIAKSAKRFLIAAGLALLLPGMAGAAGFGPAQDSFWEALVSRLWDGLVSVWTAGGSVDPNGGENGTGSDPGDSGGSIDPNG